MFLRFYKDEESREKAQEFAEKVFAGGKNVSPAQIQGYFMFHKMCSSKEVLANTDMIGKL